MTIQVWIRSLATPIVLGAWLVSPAPAADAGDRCADLAKPTTFDKQTAMAAIFCDYNGEKGGTLLPVEHTKSWNLSRAESLATPMLVSTYVEAGVERAVLVVQRQSIFESDIVSSHATSAVVSVYVFKHTAGRWQFEKGAKEALDAGANGMAPSVELVKLGDTKFGLWFEGGDIHQGYTNAYAYIVTLSTPKIAEVAHLDMGQGNPGACEDDPKKAFDGSHKCWDYEGRRDLVRVKGQDYFTLRIAYKGTENPDPNDDAQIAPKNDPVCYDFLDGEYAEMDDPACTGYKPLADKDIVVGKMGDETKKAPFN